MFRRQWAGLPPDPIFPSDLEELGYFVDPVTDEILLTDDKMSYFHPFLSKSTRINDRRRFAFTTAIQDQLIFPRLQNLGMVRITLPTSMSDNQPTMADIQPHVPIYASNDLSKKKRIVVLFGESEQELGIIAHRVIGGKGGVDMGSMVGMVKSLQGKGKGKARFDDDDGDTPGIVLANTGETWWWPEGKRALSVRQGHAVPMKSSVHNGRYYDPKANSIPWNKGIYQHVECVFETILDNPSYVNGGAVIQIIGISDGARAVEKYLDQHWDRWSNRIGCLAMLGMMGTGVEVNLLTSEAFKVFLREKSRLYIAITQPINTVISGPEGNPHTHIITTYGCPILASGEDYLSELTLIKAKEVVLAWMEEVHKAGKGYANPKLEITFTDENFEELPTWADDVNLDNPDWDMVPGRGCEAPDLSGGGLEVLSREEWEHRMEMEGKKDAPIPKNALVADCGKDEDKEDEP